MELTPALASHLTKAQSHLTHLPGLYELYRTCFASTCETTAKLLAGGEAFVFTGDIPAMWLRDSSAQVRHYLPFAGRIRSCKPCWKAHFAAGEIYLYRPLCQRL